MHVASHRSSGWWRTAVVIIMAMVAAEPLGAQITSRVDQLEVIRRDKVARLWPESQNDIANIVNQMTERGLLADSGGVRSNYIPSGPGGVNGFQPVIFGGTRPGQGFAYGIGYGRRDLWQDRFSYRVTARGTVYGGFAFDFAAEPPGLLGDRTSLIFYSKYENSPQMDYYGPGPDSSEANRSSYLLEDTRVQFIVTYPFTRRFRVGGTVGGYFVNTGPGHRGGVPSTDTVFTPAEAPGINQQTNYFVLGAGAQFDYRNDPFDPSSGGNYWGVLTEYSDRTLRKNGFIRLTGTAEQYFPYDNGGRVFAVMVTGQLAHVNKNSGQAVPFYLQPTLGGNFRLRSYADYRFTDDTSIFFVAEHRWYVSRPIYLAVFGETGTVASIDSALDKNYHWSAGVSVRFHLFNTLFMRWDNAFGPEGYRMIYSFTDLFGAGGTGLVGLF